MARIALALLFLCGIVLGSFSMMWVSLMGVAPVSASDRAEGSQPFRLIGAGMEPGSPTLTPLVLRSEPEWRYRLTNEQYRIARQHGTERPNLASSQIPKEDGLYSCVGCGLPLFRSDTKFDSRTGWPSFFKPFAAENIGSEMDTSYGMVREEVHCARCKNHLGHLFPDGPPPSFLRYCINSAVLIFHPQNDPPGGQILFFSGPDMTALELLLLAKPGILEVKRGELPMVLASSPQQELVRITFDSSQIPLSALLTDLTDHVEGQSLNRSDHAVQTIYFTRPDQESVIRPFLLQNERFMVALEWAPLPWLQAR